MPEDQILALINEQDWLQPIEEKGQELVQQAIAAAGDHAGTVANALHGVWLKHPVHAAITDVPVGSWTAALVMDVLDARGHHQFGPGADAAINVGLIGATFAAATGLADWSQTHGKARRIGAMHGVLNSAAATLYVGSSLSRLVGWRRFGQVLGLFGFGAVVAGAYLGGALAYNQKIGVNHAPLEKELPEGWKPAIQEAELSEGQPKSVDVEGVPVFLLKRGSKIFALANQCSHLGGPLAEGETDGNTVTCPWHGSCFNLRTGAVERGPATTDQPVFDVKVENGQVFVKG